MRWFFTKFNTELNGDNFNDIGMFNLVETVVVVQNAPEEIKKYADYVVPSNLEGGVLEFIEDHCCLNDASKPNHRCGV